VIRVVIADDHAIVRAGLYALLSAQPDMQVVAEASSGAEALAALATHRPAVLLLDLSMPDLDGVETITRARAAAPHTRILVLSMHATRDHVRPAIRAGAHGYVVKGSGLDDLARALRAVARGERFVDAAIADLADVTGDARDDASIDPADRLTPREREVLRRVAAGRTNRMIADELGLSPKTVDAHRTNLMRKLDLHDAQAVTRFALRHGLLAPE
jgi:DNA-binding NarL/FixJ family response regulator